MSPSSARLSRLCLAPLLLALFPPAPAAQERTREFPAHNCRYTLPAEGWDWLEPTSPAMLFLARGPQGLTAMLTVTTLPGPAHGGLDFNEFVNGFKRKFYKPGRVKKRGESSLTFQGLPCHQVEGTLANRRTVAARVFLAHGFSYTLAVVGGEAPVELGPDFEAVMGGFALTEPPAPPPRTPPGTSEGPEASLPRLMGRVAAYCLVGVAVLLALRWATRRKAPPPRDTGRPSLPPPEGHAD